MEIQEIKTNNQTLKPKVSLFGKIIIYISFILIIPIFWYIMVYNNFKRMEQNINEMASGIDIQLKKRYDLLTNLISSVKQYIKFEQDLLKDITGLRTQNHNIQDISDVNAAMDRISRSINVQLENYPDLKSVELVKNLQFNMRDAEDNISASRRLYNTTVRNYNQMILTYPSNVIASNKSLETKAFFETASNEKKNVETTFY